MGRKWFRFQPNARFLLSAFSCWFPVLIFFSRKRMKKHPTILGRENSRPPKPPKNHCRKSSQVRAVFSETEDFFQPKVQGPLAVMKIQKTPTICTVVKRKSFQQIPIPFKIKFVSPPRSPLKNCLLTKNWQAKTSRECP